LRLSMSISVSRVAAGELRVSDDGKLEVRA
jgi:hypothetical protein